MRAEEVYNIAIHLPEKELERLYALLEKKVCKQQNGICKLNKKSLISDEEARSYILKTVFHINRLRFAITGSNINALAQ